ncbi:MAG: GFA family protein [Rhodobacteraceae bacterium]|nr:GFA family protein [Paracoccaceae bacterium]
MREKITGRCLCGATTFSVSSAPRFGIRCFCTDCQHVSGGASAPQVGFERSHLDISGPLLIHERKSASGSDLAFGYCRDCGSPLTKSTTRAADLIFVYAGALDDASVVPELKPVFEDSRPVWDKG